MRDIDDIDRRILTQVQRDCAQPLERLSDKVGLSRNATWRRIKALESDGVIRGRVALLDPDSVGLGLCVFLQVRTDSHDPAWLNRFAQATRAMPEIQAVYRMSGDLDYLLRAWVADMKGYDRLYQALIRQIPMSDVSASFVMEQIKDTTELPL